MGKILVKYISLPFALWTMIILNNIIILFHFVVLFQIIPFDIVWAGKLKSVEEMLVFESISIAINVLLMSMVLIKGELLKLNISKKLVNVILWIFVIVFALNTIGNLFSKTSLETFVATPLTLISAILCLRLILNSKVNA